MNAVYKLQQPLISGPLESNTPGAGTFWGAGPTANTVNLNLVSVVETQVKC